MYAKQSSVWSICIEHTTHKHTYIHKVYCVRCMYLCVRSHSPIFDYIDFRGLEHTLHKYTCWNEPQFHSKQIPLPCMFIVCECMCVCMTMTIYHRRHDRTLNCGVRLFLWLTIYLQDIGSVVLRHFILIQMCILFAIANTTISSIISTFSTCVPLWLMCVCLQGCMSVNFYREHLMNWRKGDF